MHKNIVYNSLFYHICAGNGEWYELCIDFAALIVYWKIDEQIYEAYDVNGCKTTSVF